MLSLRKTNFFGQNLKVISVKSHEFRLLFSKEFIPCLEYFV